MALAGRENVDEDPVSSSSLVTFIELLYFIFFEFRADVS